VCYIVFTDATVQACRSHAELFVGPRWDGLIGGGGDSREARLRLPSVRLNSWMAGSGGDDVRL
jgi:hypothetical protein